MFPSLPSSKITPALNITEKPFTGIFWGSPVTLRFLVSEFILMGSVTLHPWFYILVFIFSTSNWTATFAVTMASSGTSFFLTGVTYNCTAKFALLSISHFSWEYIPISLKTGYNLGMGHLGGSVGWASDSDIGSGHNLRVLEWCSMGSWLVILPLSLKLIKKKKAITLA